MKQRDALPIFSFTNYYGAHATTELLNASDSVKYAVKTADIFKQHKRVETLLEREYITDLAAAEGRLIHLRDSEVVLFKVARSNYWQARFRIYTGKWIRFSTSGGGGGVPPWIGTKQLGVAATVTEGESDDRDQYAN